jgi:hypothetical protein
MGPNTWVVSIESFLVIQISHSKLQSESKYGTMVSFTVTGNIDTKCRIAV